jgi:hypothetical protein
MNQNKKKRIFAAGLDKLGFIEARGEQTPRLVTCWSSDALNLSSSGRTGRKSPLKSGYSLRFLFVFLLDFLLVVPN